MELLSSKIYRSYRISMLRAGGAGTKGGFVGMLMLEVSKPESNSNSFVMGSPLASENVPSRSPIFGFLRFSVN